MDIELKMFSEITKEYLLEVKSEKTKILIDIGFKREELPDDDCNYLHELLKNDDEHDAIFFACDNPDHNGLSKYFKTTLPMFFAKTRSTKHEPNKYPTRYYFNSGDKIFIEDLTITPLLDKKHKAEKYVFIINYDSDQPVVVSENDIKEYFS